MFLSIRQSKQPGKAGLNSNANQLCSEVDYMQMRNEFIVAGAIVTLLYTSDIDNQAESLSIEIMLGLQWKKPDESDWNSSDNQLRSKADYMRIRKELIVTRTIVTLYNTHDLVHGT